MEFSLNISRKKNDVNKHYSNHPHHYVRTSGVKIKSSYVKNKTEYRIPPQQYIKKTRETQSIIVLDDQK